MAINFTVGEYVIANQAYTKKILPLVTGIRKQTLSSVSKVGSNPHQVLATGMTADGSRYIQLLPQDITLTTFRSGRGTILYFPTEASLNNSFERATAYLEDKCCVKALNSTGSQINKGALVYQTGFDVAQQLPTIALASATNPATASVLGIVSADTLDGECGSVIFSGSFEGLDTSGFSNVGDRVFLSDVPGAISNVAGTVEALIGRILSVNAAQGSISLVQSLGGSGSGAMGATGMKGCTGIQGDTGVQGLGVTGLQGIQGDTGIKGCTGMQGSGDTGLQGIQGDTGIQGIQGDTGIAGLQGSQGDTGTQGIQGTTGAAGGGTGLQGETGIKGCTGIRGVTGLALGSTGVQGIQGVTGFGGGGGSVTGAMRVIRFTVGTAATTDSSTSIPSGARVQFCSFEVTTAYDAGTTIGVGRAGFAANFMTTDQNNPEIVGSNMVFLPDIATVGAVRVTITGTPAAGAGVCTVWYAEVDV